MGLGGKAVVLAGFNRGDGRPVLGAADLMLIECRFNGGIRQMMLG